MYEIARIGKSRERESMLSVGKALRKQVLLLTAGEMQNSTGPSEKNLAIASTITCAFFVGLSSPLLIIGFMDAVVRRPTYAPGYLRELFVIAKGLKADTYLSAGTC